MSVGAHATPEALLVVHDLLARFWEAVAQANLPSPSGQRARFATAVVEIGGNIIRYAYPSGQAGGLELRLRAWPDRLEARFSDRGIRYEPPVVASLPPTLASGDAATAPLPEGGFGLAIARATLDALDYDRSPDGENHWTLVSRLGQPGGRG
jgi:anti-sigma regulatory factor (Ser/Thr protein kinase)